mmetsp:Transcript_10804/g.31343  ORF Transcript_10804/g.31343 Transcript_10804/m.31343 type:complete len:212 (+) Transcript_10804:1818-2453(+)|eukprot:scaffold179021_cov29-Tisochrysis_lutea.AAC.2
MAYLSDTRTFSPDGLVSWTSTISPNRPPGMRTSPTASESSALVKSLSQSSMRTSGGRGTFSGRVRKSTSSHSTKPPVPPFISGVVCEVISSSSYSRSVIFRYGSVPEPASASIGTSLADIRLNLSWAAVDGGSLAGGSCKGGGSTRCAPPDESSCTSRPSTHPTRTQKPPSAGAANTRVLPARLSVSEAGEELVSSMFSMQDGAGSDIRAP